MNAKNILVIVVGVFCAGMLVGININELISSQIDDICYWRTSKGNIYPYQKGNFEDYKQALQRAIWDLNETGGVIYGDSTDNSTYYCYSTIVI